MIGVRLYLLQRLSAMIMVPLVFGHLGMIIYAVQGGLSTAEILSRTQGNVFVGRILRYICCRRFTTCCNRLAGNSI